MDTSFWTHIDLSIVTSYTKVLTSLIQKTDSMSIIHLSKWQVHLIRSWGQNLLRHPSFLSLSPVSHIQVITRFSLLLLQTTESLFSLNPTKFPCPTYHKIFIQVISIFYFNHFLFFLLATVVLLRLQANQPEWKLVTFEIWHIFKRKKDWKKERKWLPTSFTEKAQIILMSYYRTI